MPFCHTWESELVDLTPARPGLYVVSLRHDAGEYLTERDAVQAWGHYAERLERGGWVFNECPYCGHKVPEPPTIRAVAMILSHDGQLESVGDLGEALNIEIVGFEEDGDIAPELLSGARKRLDAKMAARGAAT